VIAEALDGTMATIEARMETKVRKGYQHDNRVSPNMAYAKFVHGESRLVVGIPDHHYHIHVFAMNATFSTPSKVAFVANTCRRKRGRSDKRGKSRLEWARRTKNLDCIATSMRSLVTPPGFQHQWRAHG
jgi:TrwC relaxase